MQDIHKSVQDYYGTELQQSEDLQTNACCTISAPPAHIKSALENVHDEVQSKYYGCGLTIPGELEGLKVLDLGSGSGRDCYIAAQLVGQKGRVVGVDMTEAQVDVAKKHEEWHRERFGYAQSNVEFLLGNIEELDHLNLEKNSFDLIISNCVINLATNKEKVLKDAFELLKPGGEIYFSDVYSDRRIPQNLQKDPVLWGECLSGALYWNDFLTLAKSSGFIDPRAVESEPITIENKALEEKVGNIQFFSVTYRLFKLEGLDTSCEDYGQAARYKGTLMHEPSGFMLDDHHYFESGKVMPVCGNTWKMLAETRFSKHFDFYGDDSMHYGIFEGCGGEMPFKSEETEVSGSESNCC